MIHNHGQIRRPSFEFIDPILHRTQRSQNQKRTICTLLAKKGEERNQLNRFPQPHFIGQNSVEPDLVQAGEPCESLELVIAHLAASD